jgi:hypothetical protein
MMFGLLEMGVSWSLGFTWGGLSGSWRTLYLHQRYFSMLTESWLRHVVGLFSTGRTLVLICAMEYV